ncbi:hypothetical protein C4K03_4709 [Pseudomonas synxantha]|uniref:Uncharacterized protein n=1 Tax=Pseudomonas synxantha TaxID=47883 RepID=A0A3G7UBV8_9PSED|nr:hypothetical protein C4K03_4709 [Pseudomonas synxantha]
MSLLPDRKAIYGNDITDKLVKHKTAKKKHYDNNSQHLHERLNKSHYTVQIIEKLNSGNLPD